MNNRRSSKCGCTAVFTFNSDTGTLIFKDHQPGQQHHPMCAELSEVEFHKKAHIFRGLQSPTDETSRLEFVKSMFADDHATRNVQVTNLLNGQIRRLAMDENNGVLPIGTPYAAPKAYTDTLIRAGKAAANGNVTPDNALSALIIFLQKEDMRHRILNEIDNNGVEVVSAIVFHDEVLAPKTNNQCTVYTADVTFGITDASCGFAKWFFLSRLLAGKTHFHTFSIIMIVHIMHNIYNIYVLIGGEVQILVAAAITREDSRTFEFIFDFVLLICPQLSTSQFVLLVDGDRATWLAARTKFLKVSIYMKFIYLLNYRYITQRNINYLNAKGSDCAMPISRIREHAEKIWPSSACAQCESEIFFLIF